MKESDKGKKLNDRLLGDEWADWKPGSYPEGIINAPKDLFLAFSFLVLSFVFACMAAAWYLILPRLMEFGAPALKISSIAFLAAALLLGAWFVLQILSSILSLKLFSTRLARIFPLRVFLTAAIKISKPFGVSRDRMISAYLKFHNDLMYALRSGYSVKKFIILLPRCLTSEARARIKELCDKYKCKAFIAGGGDEARKFIMEERPNAVIGIACERDLISGIEDIAPRIPVLALANKRPEGPCKNTLVDIVELDRIIKFCIGSDL